MTEIAAGSFRPESQARSAWRRFAANRSAVAAAGVFIAIIILAIGAPLFARYSPIAQEFPAVQGPSGSHWLGTDSLGRDVWSRLVYGSRISLEVGLASQAIALIIGVAVGVFAGFTRGIVDALLMRLTDLTLALPQLLLTMLLLVVMGNSAQVLIIALGISMWPVIARIARSEVLQLQQRDFVAAAYSIGNSHTPTLIRHIAPNATGPVLVQITFGVSQAIYAEAFLSFIGLGVAPPTPSWGSLISEGFEYVQTAPYLLVFPGVMLALALLSVNFLGDGLRDAFDPPRAK